MGPVEFLVLAFPAETIDADAIAPFAALHRSGEVRVIDSLVVTKSPDGKVGTAVSALQGADVPNLLGEEDAVEAAELLDPGTSALLLLVEHLWAAEAADAFRQAGGHVAASARIPPETLAEAQQAAP